MKKLIGLGIILSLLGCAGADKTDMFPQSAQPFTVPEISAVTVTAEDIASSLGNGPCVRCQFSEQEREINERIGQEMQAQRTAYEKLLKEGMSEEEAVQKVYVEKIYK